MEPQPVTVTVCNTNHDEDVPTGLAAAIQWLEDKRRSIPEEYRESAEIELSANWDDDGPCGGYIVITYRRLETADEIEARLKRDQVNQDSVRKTELDTLRRLKAKYPEAA